MNAPLPDAGLAVMDEMSERYFATDLAKTDRDALRAWRPRRSMWHRIKPLMARQAGMRTRLARGGDHALSYWEGGTPAGPAVVLLHGFGASKENWGYLASRLRHRYHLLVPDLPGFGDSGFDPAADYALECQADRIAGWLRELGVARAQVVGSSMGGAITAQLAARHPEQVDGVCLMNAAGVPAARMSLLESGLRAGKNYLAPATRANASRVFEIALHRRKRWLGYLFSLLMGTEMSHRKPVNDYLFGEMVRSLRGVYECLPAIRAPGFLLWGAADQVVDVSCADVFRERISGAELMVLPDVGHLPMLEEPALTARLLDDFWCSIR